MGFEWDERKNRLNIENHGIDFTDAWLIFEGPMLVGIDDREDYGEIRLVGIGYLNTIAVVIVFTEPSPEKIRVISIRKAIRYERERFEKAITNRLDET